ncbi:LysR family transcriptional regulator [Ameyamaea chiangmaiensis NBRC 103196]|nr:LysR family transcriptional regulator [Ameyamaea chiangmaiensis]GBQ71564.1 LysR family transcriptional regulator [Ameyamaea chiangmaiensis NBRC 103196]
MDRGSQRRSTLERMTLEHLRIFVAVAEREHMTRAAAALGVVQSAVSTAVSQLEEQVGMRLFNRVGRGIELTDAGRLMRDEALAVLARMDVAHRRIEDFGALRRGRLRIHASQTIASYWLPRYLVACRTSYPQVEIAMQVGNTADVVRAVHGGRAELGFIEGAAHDDALHSVFAARDGFVLVVAPSHPWSTDPPRSTEALLETDWILRERGSGTRSEFEAALSARGLAPDRLRIRLELPTNEAVRAAVEAGGGASVLSASVVAPGLEAGLLQAVRFELPERAFAAVWHRERPPGPAARALLDLIPGLASRVALPA